MEHVMHTIVLLSATAASSLVSAIWEGIILAAFVTLCLRLLPGATAAARSIVWTAALLLVLMLHFYPFFEKGSTAVSTVQSGLHFDPRWSLVIACSWGILSLARGAELIKSAIDLHRMRANATPVLVDLPCKALLNSSYRKVELCTSPDVDRPSVVGFFRPRILLPPTLLHQLSTAELEQIILHEMEHLRRADDWTNLLQKLAVVLFPLNPALNWIERRLCAERELACDDHVMRATKARKAYATCLAKLAEHSIVRRTASLALGAWEQQSEVARRVYRILRRPEEAMGARQANFVTGTVVACVFGGALALAHSPHLVDFTPKLSAPVQSEIVPSSSIPAMDVREHGVSPTLVKAVMPERRETNAVLFQNRSSQNSPMRKVNAKRTAKPTSHAVLTNWKTLPPRARYILTVSGETRPSYAAIQLEDGWLIVQL